MISIANTFVAKAKSMKHNVRSNILKFNMLIGIGTDIVSIKRIKKTLNNCGIRFVKRILNAREQLDFDQSINQINFLAKRFSAKESFAKATGYGIGSIVSFQDIELHKDSFGRPEIILSDKLKKKLNYDSESIFIHISISDEINYATAVVVIEKI